MGTPVTHVVPRRLARDLAAQLPGPEHVRALFARVPRHRFLPDVMWGPGRAQYNRAANPNAWMRAAYTDQALTTQHDDGAAEGGRGVPTSSSSAPSVMARMLTAARIEHHHRVLEIGTGTGYNAALLASMVGDDRVTSIEVDPDVAARARRSLIEAEFAPTVLTEDGEGRRVGYQPPCDRLIATCTVSRVPDVWLRQIHGRGRIVTPWAPTPGVPGGVLAVLDVDGDRAEGHFEGGLTFMWARGQRQAGHVAPAGSEADTVKRVDGDPREPWLDGDQALMLSLLMPGWRYGMRMEPDAEEPYVWIASTTCSSWARVHADGRIEQGGPRRLVDQAAQVRAWWQDRGEPDYADFGLTVDLVRGHQSVWLREPSWTLWSTKR